VGQNEGRPLGLFDNIGHGKGFPGPGDAQQYLVLFPLQDTAGQLPDGSRLIPRWFIFGFQNKSAHGFLLKICPIIVYHLKRGLKIKGRIAFGPRVRYNVFTITREVLEMFIKAAQKVKEVREHCKDGDGSVLFEGFKADPMMKHNRLFSEMVFKQGCSIGKHYHNGEAEAYYVLAGTATVDDNGTIITLNPGDMHICHEGNYHSVRNNEPDELRILAVIVTE